MHRQQLACQKCNEVFPDRPALRQHLEDHHQVFSPPQISIILDVSSSPPSETKLESCVLCGVDLTLSNLQKHLAAHMEEIALFALPLAAAEHIEPLASGKAAKSDSVSLSDASDSQSGSEASDIENLSQTRGLSQSPDANRPPDDERLTTEEFQKRLDQGQQEYTFDQEKATNLNSPAKQDPDHIAILLIGINGSGKTTFAANASGRSDLKIGHSVHTCNYILVTGAGSTQRVEIKTNGRHRHRRALQCDVSHGPERSHANRYAGIGLHRGFRRRSFEVYSRLPRRSPYARVAGCRAGLLLPCLACRVGYYGAQTREAGVRSSHRR